MPDVDLKPTAEMAANAKRGLELRRQHGKGGTAVGVARARDLARRANLSPETVRRMHSFFSRHEGNQAGGEDDAGYIAWLLWGGDAGKGWAERKTKELDKETAMRSDTYKAIASRLGMAREEGNAKSSQLLATLQAFADTLDINDAKIEIGTQDYDRGVVYLKYRLIGYDRSYRTILGLVKQGVRYLKNEMKAFEARLP